MQFTLIDFNDTGIRVSNGEQLILNSPGYAVIKDNQIAFGETAARLTHIYPRATHSDFWYKLGQDAIHSVSNEIRHNADLAFMHLTEINEQSGKPLSWLIAVPASFNREQLALLLGLLSAANFHKVKLVDSALLASASILNHGKSLHLDIQLHQTVITEIECGNNNTVINSETSTELSVLGVYEQCAKLISEAFIDQSRFDPLHNAETEQLLYEKIPAHLASLSNSSTVDFNIEYHGQSHHAVISRDAIIKKITPFYQAIKKKIGNTSQLIVSHRLQQLPGFLDDIENTILLDEHAVFTGIKHYTQFIFDTDSSTNYLSELPSLTNKKNTQNQTDQIKKNREITHVLISNTAFQLTNQHYFFTENHQIQESQNSDTCYSIYLNNKNWHLQSANDKTVILNDTVITEKTPLNLGDTIKTSKQKNTVTFIEVK